MQYDSKIVPLVLEPSRLRIAQLMPEVAHNCIFHWVQRMESSSGIEVAFAKSADGLVVDQTCFLMDRAFQFYYFCVCRLKLFLKQFIYLFQLFFFLTGFRVRLHCF